MPEHRKYNTEIAEAIHTIERKKGSKMAVISISVGTEDASLWDRAFKHFTLLAEELRPDFGYVSVTSVSNDYNDDETEEYHDDETLAKVSEALLTCGLSEEMATNAINEMQNRGILFREMRDVST